jgi:hypothetical protein
VSVDEFIARVARETRDRSLTLGAGAAQ